MMNWVKFITAFLFALILVITSLVFYNANKPFSSAIDKAETNVLSSGLLTTVNHSEVYNGTKSMVTVFGKDKEGKEKAVFIDEKTGELVEEIAMSEGVTSDVAIKTVKSELKVDKILHVKLGWEEDYPIWEVAFKSDNGTLNYVYVFFESGEWWKRILNL